MQTYVPPVNPLHQNPYNKDDMWWLDEAWNDATLIFFKSIADEIANQRDEDSFYDMSGTTLGLKTAKRFASSLEANLMSNLPGMIPSGDWIAEFLLSLEGFLDDPDAFRSWDALPYLSKATRLYAYIQSLRLKGDNAPWAASDTALELLLKFPDFNETDLEFLLLAGGSSLGIVPRSVALTHPMPEMWRFSNLLGSAYKNGAVTGPHLKALMANHSFAASPLFAEVVNFIAEERDNPYLKNSSILDEQQMLFQVARNPATPTTVLESLLAHFRPELTWVMRWDKRGRVVKAGRFSWSDDAIGEAERLVTRRSYDELSSLDAQEFKEFFNAINYHPNWAGGDHHAILEPDSRVVSSGPTDWAVERPTVEDQGTTYVQSIRSIKGRQLGAVRGRLVAGAVYSTPRETFLKEEAEGMAKSVLLGEPVHYLNMCQLGYALGSFLGAYQDLADQLGGTSENIPVEWLLEVTSGDSQELAV